MFEKVLIANRGAIACRILRTLERMGIRSVAVYSQADRHAMHVRKAGEAVAIGPSPAAESYLNIDAILDAARQTGADAIHPGYGFLSENPEFAEACEEAGIVFIGPRPVHMRAFGLKHRARELALQSEVPVAPGSGLIRDVVHAASEAARIGYPVMIKSTAGGGGIGLQLVSRPDDIVPVYERVERLARNNFKNAGIFIEKYVAQGRHIEVQIFGDGQGNVVSLGERDCSAQRRNQKVIEETPAPNLPEATRASLWGTARRLGQSVNYESAGTVEYLYDAASDDFYFLEVNTRLQVEHGVTEEVNGIDLVEWMVRQAAGDMAPLDQAGIKPKGAAIQARLYAEDPGRDFRPSSGLLTHVAWPERHTHRDLGRERHRGVAVLRSDAGEDHRHRRHARRGARHAASCARRDRDRRGRDQSRLPPPALAPRRSQAGRGADADARERPLPRQHHRGAGAGHPDDDPGLAGARRLLGRRRAALGADGFPLLPPCQPPRRQSGRRRRDRDHALGPDAQIQQRYGDLPRRRRTWRDP